MTTKELDGISLDIIQKVTARLHNYSTGIIKLVLVRDNESYNIHSGVITFLKKDDSTQEETLDYGNLVLVTELFKPKHLENIFEELSRKQTISLKDYQSLPAEGTFQMLNYYPSKTGYRYLYSEWPHYYTEYTLSKSNL